MRAPACKLQADTHPLTEVLSQHITGITLYLGELKLAEVDKNHRGWSVKSGLWS